ncbi:origin recognition complex subunit 5, putative (ORC5), partial [Plasmodium ovale curtisi]
MDFYEDYILYMNIIRKGVKENIKINEKGKHNKSQNISSAEKKQLEDEQNNTKKNRIKIYSNKNYYKDKLYDRSVVFILDNIRYLVRTHPDLFYALTRIHEYIKGPYNDLSKANKTTRGLCVILINRSPLPDEIFDGLPQPPTVWFDSYTSDMCKNILYRLYSTMCFESLLTYNDKDLKIYYTTNNNQGNTGKEFIIKKNMLSLFSANPSSSNMQTTNSISLTDTPSLTSNNNNDAKKTSIFQFNSTQPDTATKTDTPMFGGLAKSNVFGIGKPQENMGEKKF